jgi:hypothetical protein
VNLGFFESSLARSGGIPKAPTLTEFGIYSLSLEYFQTRREDAFGNVFRYRALVNPGNRQDTRDKRVHGDNVVREVGRWTYDVLLVTKDK